MQNRIGFCTAKATRQYFSKGEFKMKKRILGLALALVMIISLLPLTALALDPMPKVTVYHDGTSIHSAGLSNTTAIWFTFEDIHEDDDTTKPVIGTKIVKSASALEDKYIKFQWKKADNFTLYITMKNVDYRPLGAALNKTFWSITNNGSHGTSAFNIVMTLEGTNVIDAVGGISMNISNTGTMTITGTEGSSLTYTTTHSSAGLINRLISCGELLIKDTTVTLCNKWTDNSTGVLVNNGPVTVDNANFTVYTSKPYGIVTSTKYNEDPTDTAKGVTFKNNANVLMTGITKDDGTIAYSSAMLIRTAGNIRFENANVELHKGESERKPVTSVAPEIVGTYSIQQYKEQNIHNWSKYTGLGLEVGATVPDSANFRHFKLVHKHEFVAAGNDCTAAKACACGATEAGNGAHAGVVTDCTKDTMCTNPGCQQVYKAKVADAHEANADDGDCTTAVTCKHCTTVMTAAKEKHADSRTDCAVAGTCTNAGCTHAFAAGQHNPAADDGDCTTDIKCATCGKVVTKGQAEHKYTDKNDTTCDNAGCTNTRKVEGTENPKTGDNAALVLVLSLMAASAAAFVCTK